jgi:hypothetical protein
LYRFLLSRDKLNGKMNPESPELARLLERLPEARLLELLRAAGITETPPWIGSYRENEPREWAAQHRSKLGAVIARFTLVPNHAVSELFGEELQRLAATSPNRRASLTFKPRQGNPTEPVGDEVPLQLVTASAAIFFQLYADIHAAGRLTDPPAPPSVTLQSGSVQFSFGSGALLLSGISLVVAAAPTLVGSPFALAGGLVLITLGLVDQTLNWRKTLVDTKAASVTLSKVELEREKLKLEIEKEKLELERLRLGSLGRGGEVEARLAEDQIRRAYRELESLGESEDPPPSSLVPQEIITQTAEREGVSVGLAHHLVNRALPAFLPASAYFEKIDLSVTSRKPAAARKR